MKRFFRHALLSAALVASTAALAQTPVQTRQVVAGIRANGVETWFVLYADEGHGFLKKHNNDLRREVETVFLKKLFEGK